MDSKIIYFNLIYFTMVLPQEVLIFTFVTRSGNTYVKDMYYLVLATQRPLRKLRKL